MSSPIGRSIDLRSEPSEAAPKENCRIKSSLIKAASPARPLAAFRARQEIVPFRASSLWTDCVVPLPGCPYQFLLITLKRQCSARISRYPSLPRHDAFYLSPDSPAPEAPPHRMKLPANGFEVAARARFLAKRRR